MSASKLRILLLENSGTDAVLMIRELREVAIVDVAINGPMFRTMLDINWDCVLVDLGVPDITGEEAIRLAKSKHPKTPVIITTGSVTPRQADIACEAGAARFLMKGLDGVPGLSKAVTQAYEHAKQSEELESLKAQTNRDQRIELLGNLSAGIVHDFNGILQVFTMGIPLLRSNIIPADEKILDQMESASKRGAELTSQILTFARGSNGTAFKQVAVTYLLGEVGSLIRATFPANIRVHIKTEIGTSTVRGDATQLLQVIQNLSVNAKDSMMPRGGELRIHAQNVHRVEGMPGSCVHLSVSDSGSGIPDDVLAKIFTPFFTTKPPGMGSGLGLSTVRRIVEAHNGILNVQTKVGEGTTFNVFLPISLTNAEVQSESDVGQGKTIVVADDDATIREFTQLLIESAGYHVLSACHGVEALSLFRTGKEIHALVTDQSMPILDGNQLVEKLRADGIKIPVIMLSGYDSTPSSVEVSATLRKPVTRERLLATLKDVLCKPS